MKEKFGKALADVHGPVPGLGQGTRNAGMIERIFSNLKVEKPVERFNWFLLRNPALYLPELEYAKGSLFDAEGKARISIRVERQTLRRLPESGDILFTIRICINSFDQLRSHTAGQFWRRPCASRFWISMTTSWPTRDWRRMGRGSSLNWIGSPAAGDAMLV